MFEDPVPQNLPSAARLKRKKCDLPCTESGKRPQLRHRDLSGPKRLDSLHIYASRVPLQSSLTNGVEAPEVGRAS